MSGNRIKLSQNDRLINKSAVFGDFWNDKHFSDVTLATMDDLQITAHKVILSSCSSFFKNIFINNSSQNLTLYLKDVKHNELEKLIEFLYLGECDVPEDDLASFIATGKDLKIKGLLDEESDNKDIIEQNGLKSEDEAVNEESYDDNSFETETDFTNTDAPEVFLEPLLKEDLIKSKPIRTKKSNISKQKTWKEKTWKEKCVTNTGAPDVFVKPLLKEEINESKPLSTNNSNILTQKSWKEKCVENGISACFVCTLEFTSKGKLQSHNILVHETKIKLSPGETKDQLQPLQKVKRETPNIGVEYKCNQCEFTVERRQTLRDHKKTKHNVVRSEVIWFRCPQCDFKTDQKETLKDHIENIHIGVM